MRRRPHKTIAWMALFAWGTPMALFTISALLSGKALIVFAMMTCMSCSLICGWLFAFIADLRGRDHFDAYVIGMLVGLYLSLWPVGRAIL